MKLNEEVPNLNARKYRYSDGSKEGGMEERGTPTLQSRKGHDIYKVPQFNSLVIKLVDNAP